MEWLVFLYFLALLFIGGWASRKIEGVEDYIVAGRNLGFLAFTILVVGSICSGMTILGVAGLGYIAGWPTIWEQIFVPLSAAFCILFLGTKLHRIGKQYNYLTIQDYFSHRFYSKKKIRFISAIVGIAVSLIYLVGQYTAISIVLTWLLGITHVQALTIASTIVVFYVLLGGLYAVAWTTLVQGIILIIGVLLLSPPIIEKAGGLTHINRILSMIDPNFVKLAYPQVHPPYANYAFCTPAFIISLFFLLVFGLASAPHVINNVLAAKEKKYFKFSPFLAFSLYVIIMYLIKLSGFAVRAMAYEGHLKVPRPDYAFIVGVEHVLSPFAWSIFAVVVLAAVMSTTDRLLFTIGTYFGWDIYRILKSNVSQQELTLVSRIAILASAIVSLILAINPPKLLAWLIWMGIGIMLSSFTIPLIAGLYWKRATKEGAIASMASGFFTAIVFGYIHKFVYPLPMHFSFFSFGISFITMVVVSILTPPPPEKIIKETKTGTFILGEN